MTRHGWHCPSCHTVLGRLTTDRDGRAHLHVRSERVTTVRPGAPQTWTVTCRCGAVRPFTGEQVHLEDRRVNGGRIVVG
jgi:hypothetical protein